MKPINVEVIVAMAVNVIVMFIGWYIVNRQAEKREKDKEKRLLAEKTIGLVEELEECAIAYHKGNKEKEHQVNILLEKTSRYLHRLHLDQFIYQNIHIIELRQAIALYNFGSDWLEAYSDDSSLINGIRLACNKMILFIDNEIIKIS